MTGEAEPSDEEIQNYYEKNKEAQFTTPEQRCVRHILFNKDQKEKAEDIKKQLENGGDFAKLAKENSQTRAAPRRAGILVASARARPYPEFEQAAFGAERGEIVGPVQTEFGYHILQVTDVKPEQTRSLQEVESQIRPNSLPRSSPRRSTSGSRSRRTSATSST